MVETTGEMSVKTAVIETQAYQRGRTLIDETPTFLTENGKVRPVTATLNEMLNWLMRNGWEKGIIVKPSKSGTVKIQRHFHKAVA